MNERPILFSGPMVRAILDGRKSQTRRVVKPQPKSVGLYWRCVGGNGFGFMSDEGSVSCPYGATGGSRLWVRETFVLENTREYHGDHDVPIDGRPIQKHESGEEHFWLIPHYRATDPEPHIVPYSAALKDENDDRTRWMPSIHMPRWASRITLDIISIRVERLQDISEAEAIAEGVDRFPGVRLDDDTAAFSRIGPVVDDSFPIARYAALWESINGQGSWAANPWVWVVEFMPI